MNRSIPASLANGIDESCPLSFHSPYGCSKGAADQYVLDYARSYGMPNVVFRMSCIYGPHQCGTEDQGWVAHFLFKPIAGQPITLYGDGMQVRDMLFVEDLVDAMLLAQRQRSAVLGGRAFNIGGGPRNAMSLLELLEIDRRVRRAGPAVRFDDWRVGDQRYYVSDTRAFQSATGWKPRIERSRRVVATASLAAREQLRLRDGAAAGCGVKYALVNPNWSFEGSIYFGCREPHLPLEYGYSKALLERAGHEAYIIDGQMEDLSIERHSQPRSGFRARFHRRHHRAELSVLAMRSSGTARSPGDRCEPCGDVGGNDGRCRSALLRRHRRPRCESSARMLW